MVRAVVSALLLIVFGLASLAASAALLLGIVPRAEIHATSGKVLAGALISLGIGAFLAALDPHRHRIMIVVAILFSLSCAAAIGYRLRYEHHVNDPARFLLPLVIAYPLLALIFFPFGEGPAARRARIEARRDEWWADDRRRGDWDEPR